MTKLEELSLNHKTWQQMALTICKNTQTADIIVSDMYWKLKDYTKEINPYYIFVTIKSCFINYLRQENQYTDLADKDYFNEETEIEYKEIPDCLTWGEKQILTLRYNRSLRDIESQFKISHMTISRIEKKAHLKIKEYGNIKRFR